MSIRYAIATTLVLLVLAGTMTTTATAEGTDTPRAARPTSISHEPKIRSCSNLRGAGSFQNPQRLGRLRRGVHIFRGCPPLSSGVPFNRQYFRFTLRRANTVHVGTLYHSSTRGSGVSPRLATARGRTIATGFRHGFFLDVPEPFRLRVIRGGTLPRGKYVAGTEKLSSPLSSLRTVPYDLVIWVGS